MIHYRTPAICMEECEYCMAREMRSNSRWQRKKRAFHNHKMFFPNHIWFCFFGRRSKMASFLYANWHISCIYGAGPCWQGTGPCFYWGHVRSRVISMVMCTETEPENCKSKESRSNSSNQVIFSILCVLIGVKSDPGGHSKIINSMVKVIVIILNYLCTET